MVIGRKAQNEGTNRVFFRVACFLFAITPNFVVAPTTVSTWISSLHFSCCLFRFPGSMQPKVKNTAWTHHTVKAYASATRFTTGAVLKVFVSLKCALCRRRFWWQSLTRRIHSAAENDVAVLIPTCCTLSNESERCKKKKRPCKQGSARRP